MSAKEAQHENVDKKPITLAETGPFLREAVKLFSEVELEALKEHVSQFRELGPIIRGTGGLRKLRWATDNNKGKSHGARVIYYYGHDNMPLYLIAVYAKSQKGDLSEAEKKVVKKFVSALKEAHDPDLRRKKLKLIKGARE
jgi:hypothetical protein